MISEDPPSSASRNEQGAMPGAVRAAIIGIWLSVAIGQSFNVYQALVCEGGLDWHAMLFSSFIVSSAVLVYLQLAAARVWARTAYLLLLVLSYSLMALDESGLTRLDIASFCLTAPIDLFVLTRLFVSPVAEWFTV